MMILRVSWLIGLCWLLAVTVPAALSLKIGAFNVRVLGPSKASNNNVMKYLAQIAVRYDILLIQEIRDNTGEAIQQLLQRIRDDHGVEMKLAISDRLGRTKSKEQYAFLYREDHGIKVLKKYVYKEESGTDPFEREPYIVQFRASNCALKDFTLVAIHIAPLTAVSELIELKTVYEDVRRNLRTDNIIIMGDLNAACSYVPKKRWPDIDIRQNSKFWWPIGDEVDTTVNSNTDCAYDRFIIAGEYMKAAVLPGSAGTFDFPAEYGLTEEKAMNVSDHYPIELSLQNCQSASSKASHRHQAMSTVMQGIQKLWKQFVGHFSRQHKVEL